LIQFRRFVNRQSAAPVSAHESYSLADANASNDVPLVREVLVFPRRARYIGNQQPELRLCVDVIMRCTVAELLRVSASLFLALALSGAALAQDSTFEGSGSKGQPDMTDVSGPAYCLTNHNIGRIVLGVSNWARIGRLDEVPFIDYFTGLRVYNLQMPKGSVTNYLWKGGLWVGAVVGRDTLVSCATDVNNRYREINPDQAPFGNMIRRSIIHPEWPGFADAVSEQDFVSMATDTNIYGNKYPSFDALDGRAHKPLPISVTQKSYAWSYDYASDFVLFDWGIRNIGTKAMKDVYIGLYMDFDCHIDRLNPYAQNSIPGSYIKPITEGRDDLTGYLFASPASYQQCNFLDTVRMAWTTDNNGDPGSNGMAVPGVVGVRFLGPYSEMMQTSYNWWVFNYNAYLDYGPQKIVNYRFMGGGTGTPVGDRSKYAMMRNGEIDFDQSQTAQILPTDRTWIAADYNLGYSLVRGGDNQFVLSLGPFQLGPGQSVQIPWALVGGENFHEDPYDFMRYMQFQYNPFLFYQHCNFAEFSKNAVWASWVYDNPGVDTDGDGYFGKSRICVTDSAMVGGVWQPSVAETTYYEGDGVPDWRGAEPPFPPHVWVYPQYNALRIRFNGQRSETSKDVFSNILDFEGYRVYISRDERESSYSLVASYDRENYDKWVYNPNLKPVAGFELKGIPMTLPQIRCLYGQLGDPCNDSTFDPLKFTRPYPYQSPLYPDSIFYFTKHDYNASKLGVNTPITKIYPDAPPPSAPPLPSDYTDDGYLKYYEYQMVIDSLLPTVPYWVSVTAFDFGSPSSGLEPLESGKTIQAVSAFPDGSRDTVVSQRKVYIYPNPYRIDDPYRRKGFEGRTQPDRSDDRVRAIYFANLPPKCTIRIFTLDGDLVRQLDHDFDPSDPNASHDKWDMITRNTQMIVSGIYYWTVQDDKGSVQIGKLVVIM